MLQTNMETSLTSLFSFFFLFLFSTSLAALPADSHNDLFQCFSSNSQNVSSISSVTYTPTNSSYQTIFSSANLNLLPLSNPKILKPLAIITPLDESQIPVIITCSRLYGIEIRTRSGAHDHEGLSYISESPFIILDLRNLRSITIDTESRTLWVQTGAILGELYYAIANKSRTLAFPAGTCPTVGVGGHISGGGFGMISRKYGLAIDHVIDARIADVNGQVLDRESMGEDLFWAIRGGGGGSFGVVLAWKLNLVSISENVTVFNVTRTLEQNATELVLRWQNIADKLDDNLVIRLFFRSVYSNRNRDKTIRVTFRSVYIGGVESLLQIMQENFPELGLLREDCTELSWIESILYIWLFPYDATPEDLLDRTMKNVIFFKGKSDFLTEPIPEKGLLGLWERLNQETGADEMQLTPYGGRMSEISESELPFPHRAGTRYMIEYNVFWYDQGSVKAQRHVSWIRELYNYMGLYVSKNPRRAYVNYRDLDLGMDSEGNTKASIWGIKYFKNNFERLVRVKTKVDPTNFFKNQQSIPLYHHLEAEKSKEVIKKGEYEINLESA